MKNKLLKSLFGLAAVLSATTTFAASGGPDSFGYTWKDSNEPGGPAYNWIEIATPAGGSGTYRSAINCDDCHEANIPLGFNFPYYGVNSNAVSIGSNGVVYFENTYLGLANSCMPGTPSYTMTQYKFIAHLWDDLAPNYQGGIYTQAFPNYFVIEYYNIVPCCAVGDGDTWQVILFRNGNILMQYQELSAQGLQTDLTVGIQNDPTTGLQYVCNGAGIPLASGRALLFSPPSFSCTSVSQNLLPVTSPFCTGGNVILSSGTTAIAQTWSNAAMTPTITVSANGSYSVMVLDTNGCTLRDTTNVMEFAAPVADLGPDVTSCGSAVLDPGVSGLNYMWNDMSTNQTLTASTSGTYSVVVTDPISGCSDNDDIVVTINTNPVVALGADVTQCEGTVTLDAGNTGLSYMWNDMSTNQTLVASASGSYFVTVTDIATSCSDSDTIVVTINSNPVVNLGADTSTCAMPVGLDAGNAGFNFMWSDMSTNQNNIAMVSGTYFVMVMNPSTTCFASDTIVVTINANPAIDLGADSVQCGGTVILDAGNAGSNHVWNDSSTTQMITVSASGNYFVNVTDPVTGCTSSDSVLITINTNLTVNLGADTIQCGGNIVLDAGNTGSIFMWSDSSNVQSITVNSSGTYDVVVTDPNTGCTGMDTISVVIHALPTVTFTLTTTTICSDDASLTLTGGSPAGGSFSGNGVSAGMFDPSVGVGPQMITYTFTDANGCTNSAVQIINVSACVGISEHNNSPVTVYPNPASDVLIVESASNSNVITVFNSIGETVLSQQSNNMKTTLDLTSLTSGIYVVQVVNADGIFVEKVVLQK
jgi:hypothetical protein